MDNSKHPRMLTRRAACSGVGQALAAIAVVCVVAKPAMAKPKSAKDDFFFQEEPDESGKNCTGCINFTAKSTGKYGADSGDCALLEGDVCSHCYCSGWTDKNAPNSKKAGT